MWRRLLIAVTACSLFCSIVGAAPSDAAPDITMQPVEVPGEIVGPLSTDGRFALVSGGITMYVSDATDLSLQSQGLVPHKAQFVGTEVWDMTSDARSVLVQGWDTTPSPNPSSQPIRHGFLKVIDRIAGSSRLIAYDLNNLWQTSMSNDGSVVAWSTLNADAVWIKVGSGAAFEVTGDLLKTPWAPLQTNIIVSPPFGHFGPPVVSGDGQSVLFTYFNNVQPECGIYFMYCKRTLLRYDLATSTRSVANLNTGGTPETSSVGSYGISANGRYLMWTSSGCGTICWRDTQADVTTRPEVGLYSWPTLSDDGLHILGATFVPPADASGTTSAKIAPYVYDVILRTKTTLPLPADGSEWCTYCQGALNADGTKVWLKSSKYQGYVVSLPPAPPSGKPMSTLVPGRLYDSRDGASTVDGIGAGGGTVRADYPVHVSVAGRHGIPMGAAAATLTVTVTGTTAPGFLTVWPCGTDRPNASNLNYGANATIANTVIAKIGTKGEVCITSSATTDLIVDVGGFQPIGTSFVGLVPGRLMDSRDGGGTVDGVAAGDGAVAADTTVRVKVGGRHGVPASAGTAVLNVTATGTRAAGFLTVWPCGTDAPNASNLNYSANATIANTVITKIGTNGEVCITSSATTDLIVDISGFQPSDTSFTSLVPGRLLDTRLDGTTIDGILSGGGPADATAVLRVKIAGRHGIPSNAGAAVLNVTATGTRAAGFLTVWPCGADAPNASNLNYGTGTTMANTVISKIGTNGEVCITSSATTDLIVDVSGFSPTDS